MSWWRTVVVCGTIAVYAAGIHVVAGAGVAPQQPLHDLPFQIGGWSGSVVPADPVLLQRAQPDAVVHRRYAGTRGRVMLLYVGYYERQASRGQTLALCSGRCTILDRGVVTIPISGELAQINRARVILNGTPMMVAYWFQHGRDVIADPFRNKIAQIRTGLVSRRSDGAVVRISTPIAGDDVTAWGEVLYFARAVHPLLLSLLPE